MTIAEQLMEAQELKAQAERKLGEQIAKLLHAFLLETGFYVRRAEIRWGKNPEELPAVAVMSSEEDPWR